MPRARCVPNVVAVNAALNVLGRAGAWREAVDLLDDMVIEIVDALRLIVFLLSLYPTFALLECAMTSRSEVVVSIRASFP